MRLFLLILTSCLLLLSSACDVKRRLSRHKESTETTTTHESSQTRRTEIDHNWSRIGSSLFHRNGALWIEFDSIASISIGPDQQISAVGFNPVIRSTSAETRRDTTTELGRTRARIQEDSTGKHVTQQKKEVLTVQKDKEQKSQKITPMIFTILLVLLLIAYLVKRFLP